MPNAFDDDDVARLRIALARIARQVDRQVSGDGLTRTQLSVLGTVARLKAVGVRRTGRHRRAEPDHAVAGASASWRRPGWWRGRPRRPTGGPCGCGPRAAGRALQLRLRGAAQPAVRRPAGRAAGAATRLNCWPRCRRWRRWPNSSPLHRAPSRPAQVRPGPRGDVASPELSRQTFAVAGQPQLPPVLQRPGDLAGRHLDADRGPVLAGAAADRLGHRARPGGRAADAAGAAARPVRRGGRRPGRQAPADDRRCSP